MGKSPLHCIDHQAYQESLIMIKPAILEYLQNNVYFKEVPIQTYMWMVSASDNIGNAHVRINRISSFGYKISEDAQWKQKNIFISCENSCWTLQSN